MTADRENDLLPEIWDSATAVLRSRIPAVDYNAWFVKARPIAVAQHTATLELANDFAVRNVTPRFTEVLSQTFSEIMGRPLDVEVVSRETGSHEKAGRQNDAMTIAQIQREAGRTASAVTAAAPTNGAPSAATYGSPFLGVSQTHSFATFIIGESNQLAHAAALRCAADPGNAAWNPLLLVGPSGTGKSHLVHAIHRDVQETRPELAVAYASAEALADHFGKLIGSRDTAGKHRLKSVLRSADVLLIDDFGSLAGRSVAMQEELLHSIDAVQQRGGQVLIVTNVEPADLTGIDPRLIARVTCGLPAPVDVPDAAVTRAIARRKAEALGHRLSEPILDEIAALELADGRAVEGAVVRLLAHASLTGHELSVENARTMLASLRRTGSAPVTIERIQQEVCAHFGVTPDQLASRSRSRDVVLPRWLTLYLARELLGTSSNALGRRYHRDHSSVLHAQRQVERRIKDDPAIDDIVRHLRKTIQSSSTASHPGGAG